MMADRPKMLLAFGERIRESYVEADDLARLERFATWEWLPQPERRKRDRGQAPCGTPAEALAALAAGMAGVQALIVCHGCPRITAEFMDSAPDLRVIGELEGDRFGARVDVEAAWQRGIRCLDTTNASSYPMAEWALGLILISLRNAGAHFRSLICGDKRSRDDFGYTHGELTGKRVGLIGCGHGGRRLIKLLRPFDVDIRVHDPYMRAETADILDVLQTSLDYIFTDSDVIVCMAPLTPQTRSMIGRRELDLIPPGRVLVNVSRGEIIELEPLAERLRRGDITAGLDVFGQGHERGRPMTPECDLIGLPNVFVSPHIAGVTLASRARFFELMVDELDRLFHGHEPRFELTASTRANRRGEGAGTAPGAEAATPEAPALDLCGKDCP
jgi:D-3-phosphoglycerate dehydrogenase / 2-oxoglutarate reductase